jgi:hypothetical protein
MRYETQYIDVDNQERETLFFFMFNAFLQARIDTDNESDADEDVNLYMAHLLHSVVDGRFYGRGAESLASSPVDLYEKVNLEETPRHKMRVYRTNADHRLIAFGLFDGDGDRRSFYRQACTNPDPLGEAQQYYSWAALFGKRLPSQYGGLAQALEKLSERFDTYREVIGHMRAEYFGLIHRLSDGEVFHLEREAHEAAMPVLRDQALEVVLEIYAQWQAEPTAENRKRFQRICAEFETLKENRKDELSN